MKFVPRLLMFFLIVAPHLQAHDVITTRITWSREVVRIVYRSCAPCHREGASAFPLTTYEEARPWAKAIKEEVLARRMPPWNAVKGFGDLRNDRGLTQEDLEIIGEWVEGGAPEGNPALNPPVPASFGRSAEPSRAARTIVVRNDAILKQSVRAIGIEPGKLALRDNVQVIAERPEGGIEPLIWIQQFNSAFKGPYYFRQPLQLPAGTRIEIAPSTAAVSLLLK